MERLLTGIVVIAFERFREGIARGDAGQTTDHGTCHRAWAAVGGDTRAVTAISGLTTEATRLATEAALWTASGCERISVRSGGLRLRRIAGVADQEKSQDADANQANPDIRHRD